MFGTAYFKYGYTEPITSYHFNPNKTELYFTTHSGTYGFKQHAGVCEYDIAFTQKNKVAVHNYSFYKYAGHDIGWQEISLIDHIEIYTEVLSDGRL